MSRIKLHLDADTSRVSSWRELLKLGHDVTRTPNEWMPMDASDEYQLLGSTAQGRCIFTFNIRDFVVLSQIYPLHSGIILSSQKPLPMILNPLNRLLGELDSEAMRGQIRWLNDWL